MILDKQLSILKTTSLNFSSKAADCVGDNSLSCLMTTYCWIYCDYRDV